MKFQAILTVEAALEAVKQNGDALRYVKDQTEAVALEAVALAGTASVLAIGVGTVLAHAMLGNIRADTGAPIAVLFPTAAVAGIVIAGLVTGILGSISPARRAVTFDPAEVMRTI